jgi:hypothetical protein
VKLRVQDGRYTSELRLLERERNLAAEVRRCRRSDRVVEVVGRGVGGIGSRVEVGRDHYWSSVISKRREGSGHTILI